MSPVLNLPQLSSCGPIEALHSHRAPRDRRRLPQLSSCGPIEAQLAHVGYAAAIRTFRNCQVAAPLKPNIIGDGDMDAAAFRNCQVAAPLKRLGHWTLTHRYRAAFRNCQVAAPLKPVVCEPTARVFCPSATVKLRPH